MRTFHEFGKNSGEVSLFTLGTMRAIGSSNEMYEIIKAGFLLADINHLETAPSYGPSEIFIGKAINRLKNQQRKCKYYDKFYLSILVVICLIRFIGVTQNIN